MNWQSLTCVQGLMDGLQFRLSVDDIVKSLGVSNEGGVTYFENVTPGGMSQRCVSIVKLD